MSESEKEQINNILDISFFQSFLGILLDLGLSYPLSTLSDYILILESLFK